MIVFENTTQYQKQLSKFVKNNNQRAEALIKTLDLFAQNPAHPSLNLEKLVNNTTWTVRIDKGNRIFFRWIDASTALLLDIGKHDKYRKY